MKTIKLDIVSAEKKIFSSEVASAHATLALGGVGILPGHAPMLSHLKPGELMVTHTTGTIERFYISGGIIEVLPEKITVLADTAARSDALDEAIAIAAEQKAKAKLEQSTSKADYGAALTEISAAAAQIRIIKASKK
jgi:F-type H+-transporting ATPase subunit epsilon